MRVIRLVIAYDGSSYHGFQRQLNASATIQQLVEDRLTKIFGHKLVIHGAGRTDTGVHAQGQVVHFSTTGTIPTDKIVPACRSVLPDDIVVLAADEVPEHFHAQKSALSKTYLYRIYQSDHLNPFWRNYAWHLSYDLDYPAMQQALLLIIGTHDFSSFKAAGSAKVSPVRTILNATCVRAAWPDGGFLPGVSGAAVLYDFVFEGTGFLYHMVRNLMGTLVNVGTHKITVQAMQEILAAKNRHIAGKTAPPQGLYLLAVNYGE
jgi:tRNA pseudouridine38-40 synthase